MVTRSRVAALSVRDTVVRRPAGPEDVPAGPWAVTPTWLTGVLCREGDPVVSAVHYRHLSSGTSDRGFLDVRYDGVPSARLPNSIFIKSAFSYRTRLQSGITGGLEGEARYYARIQPTVPVLSPRGLFGRTDRRSGRAVVLMEDIARSRSATFGDAVRRPLDRSHADALVDTLATLHGSLWESDRFTGDLRWVPTSSKVQQRLDALVDFPSRVLAGLRRAVDIVPSVLVDHGPDLHQRLLQALHSDEGGPTTLLHADVHADNWFTTPDGGMGLFDWTALSRGRGERDLAYALASALTVEDRRAWERDLVQRYDEKVAQASGRRPDRNAAWDAYRRQTLHGLCYWLYTIGRGRFQPQMQPADTTRVNVERLAQATADLETLREPIG
jgi:aminoglycoside phosphotransferase (APT) family kinase protein